MDLGFIEEEHRHNVQRLTEICGINMEEAFKLYVHSNYDLDTAINQQFNSPVRPHDNSLDQHQIYANSIQSEFDDADHAFNAYEVFINSDMSFEQRYKGKNLKQPNKLLKRLDSRNAQELTFLQKLQNLIGHHSNLKIETSTLIDALQKCWKQRLPFIIFTINFSCSDSNHMKEFFKENREVQKILNQQFRLIGVDMQEYKLQQSLRQLKVLKQKTDCLVLGRINYLDQIEIVSSIKITNDIQDMMQNIRKGKVQCVRRELDESHIIKQFNQRRKGNFHYRRPKSYKQYIKIREDRRIRQQQDKEFHQAYVAKNTDNQKNQQRSKGQNNFSNIEQSTLNVNQIQKRRQQTRKLLKRYESGLSFKIRLPSGQNLLINVEGSEKVQYLFDYIESFSQKLGFNDQLNRKFDIFIGLGSSDTLRDKRQQKLQSIFQHPEILIVRELQA